MNKTREPFVAVVVASVLLVSGSSPAAATAPEITAETWLNSEPLSMPELRGKVVLVEFWTYGCYNCKNVEPYLQRWHNRYADQGLVILAVHSPEFDYESKLDNVRRYIADNGIDYAVPVDNDFSTWRAFGNRAWPTFYLIDKRGEVVYSHIGEGAYEKTEATIRRLLAENAAS